MQLLKRASCFLFFPVLPYSGVKLPYHHHCTVFLGNMLIDSALHLAPKWVHMVLKGQLAGVVNEGQVLSGLFSVAINSISATHVQKAAKFWFRFKRWAAKRHTPFRAARATSCPLLFLSKEECNLASQHACEWAVPLISLLGLFWAELIDTPW